MAFDLRWFLLILVTSICCIVAPTLGAAEIPDKPQRHTIEGMRTHAFYHEHGLFDDRELQDPRLALRNVSSGTNHLRGNTGSTLVLVDVSGVFTADVKGTVELVAEAEGDELLAQKIPFLDLYTEKREITAPFLVYGTGCGDLVLRARVRVNGKVESEKTGIVPFRCGE